MAFLKELTNLNTSCFNQDELEEMMQWYVIQRGDGKNAPHGMITHFYDAERAFHWFHYLETEDGNEENGSWRMDVHFDSGRESDAFIQIEQAGDTYLQTEDDRFDTSLPAVWVHGSEKTPVVLEVANKNDLKDQNAGENIAVNLNMFAYNIDIIHTKKEYAARSKTSALPKIGEFIPAGLLYSMVTSKDAEQRDLQFEALLQDVVKNYRVNPVTFANGIFKIKNFEQIATGEMTYLYDVTVDCQGTDLHIIVPPFHTALKDLKKGRYLYVNGMMTAMVLPEEDLRHKQDSKNNLLQFKPVH